MLPATGSPGSFIGAGSQRNRSYTQSKSSNKEKTTNVGGVCTSALYTPQATHVLEQYGTQVLTTHEAFRVEGLEFAGTYNHATDEQTPVLSAATLE